MRCRRAPRWLTGAVLAVAWGQALNAPAQQAATNAPAAAAPSGSGAQAAANAPGPRTAVPGQGSGQAGVGEPRSLSSATFPAQQRPAGDPRLIARGETLYGINCKACHGADLRGGDLGGPNLLRSQIVLGDRDGEGIIPVVRKGRVPENGGTPMPALPLADADIRAVAAYLHGVLAKQQRQGAPPEGPERKLNILVGNAASGRRYFQAHCAGCHSAGGDLAGIGRRITDAGMLQDSWVAGRRAATAAAGVGTGAGVGAGASQAPDPRRLVTVDVRLATGEHFHGTLERVDDFVVSLRSDDGRYLSFTRRGNPAVSSVELHDPMAQHRALLGRYSDEDMHDVTAYLATLK